MGHHHQPHLQPGEEPLQALQPVEVEVVGGLVEEEGVVAGEQDPGEGDPGGLPSRERRHVAPEQVGGQP